MQFHKEVPFNVIDFIIEWDSGIYRGVFIRLWEFVYEIEVTKANITAQQNISELEDSHSSRSMDWNEIMDEVERKMKLVL